MSTNYKQLMEKVDKLTNEQKHQAALEVVNKEMGSISDPVDQARAITKALQLEMSLHGYETAVKEMKARKWPSDLKAQVLLNMYYGRALQNYAQSYSWEIRQREKTVSNQEKDLKKWTVEEIYLEAYKHYYAAWAEREKLGKLDKNVLDDFVVPNTYPSGVKDTLRDSLTYLFVQLLDDTGGWSPAQSNEIFKLSLKSLLRGKAGSEKDLLEERVHPLQKMAFILEDLRSWNEKKKSSDAALQAQITLFDALHRHFTQSADRELIRSELNAVLNASDDTPWYSMAAATLASFWQQDSGPDSLVQALNYAQKGAKKFPSSLGAARCRDIVEQIQMPSLQLSSMRFDSAGERSLGVHYKNMKKVYFRSYKFDIKDFILKNKNYNLVPDWNVFRNLLGKPTTHEWSVSVEETTDYREHWHYVTPPKHENGFYVIVASMTPDFRRNENILTGTMMSFGPLVLAMRNNYQSGDFEIEAFTGADGKALPELKIDYYTRDYNKPIQHVSSANTDKSGRTKFKADGKYINRIFMTEYKGEVAFSEFYVNAPSVRGLDPDRAMIYTDRAIYRPNQKIQWKAVFYRGSKQPGKFHTVPNTEYSVQLHDLNGEVIETIQARTDAFGAAWGEFKAVSGRALGQWWISAAQDSHYVRVEEYKRPTFELSWDEQKTPIRLNHSGEVVGEAKYYFGQALNKGQVKYKIEKTVSFPWWWWGYWDFSYWQRAQIVKSGEAKVDDNGKFKIEFTPEADSRVAKMEGVKYLYNISVDVTDEGGETRSSSKMITVAKAAVEATWGELGAVFDTKSTKVSLSRALIAGGPAPGKGTWELVSLKEPEKTVMPAENKAPSFMKIIGHMGLKVDGDLQQPRWAPQYNWKQLVRDWKDGAVVKSGSITADERGSAKMELPDLKPGAYRLKYKSKDMFGESVETQSEFFVADDEYRPKLPLLVFTNGSSLKVGDTAKIWIPSGLKNQSLIFEAYQDGSILERRYLNSDADSLLIKWPIKEEHRGGISFSIRLLNDFQALTQAGSIFVPWDNKEITIETKTFRDKLFPGQKEKWTFVLKGPNGEKLKKASAQLLAYMYDRSLDALAPHSSPDVMGIYPNRSASAAIMQYMLGSGLNAYFEHEMYHRTEYSPPADDYLQFYASYGIGGPGRRNRYGSRGSPMMAMSKAALAEESDALPASPVADMAANAPAGAPMRSMEGESKKEKRDEAAPQKLVIAPEVKEDKPLRSNFSETAFFIPNLTNNENGEVEVSFEIPDSVTSWTLWLQSFTKDLNGGSMSKQVETVKDLMVRPYMPRFLREADLGVIKVVVNNTSDREMKGTLDIEITDENQKGNLAAQFGLSEAKLKGIPFTIKAKKSFDYEVPMVVPAKLGMINFKAQAKSGTFTDGELRPLPILPGRFHLIQSRFVSLKDKETRSIQFDELVKGDDKTRLSEKMVVQVDAQLFYSVLSALPYLVNEPYECIEQTLNRFLSTGILTSVFNKYPSIETMAKKMSSRKTRNEAFNQPDPNLKMTMEETPWLVQSRGGAEKEDDLIKVLDSSIARHTRNDALQKLEKAQLSSGGFPWFPGGPPSPYITLYLVYGFSKALEFGVEVPKPMIQKAWSYLHEHYITHWVGWCMAHDSCWEEITFLNYVLSNYPDESWGNNVFSKEERKTMLEFSFRHWRNHSPYLKGYLALTLHRAKQNDRAKLVWDSVMDSAKYVKDEGTHWQREDRSWLWYNDTIETHAFALRTLLELNSDNVKRDGIVEWLFLNKKLNHWKSTRATAEVIYSLAKYLTQTDQLGKKEAVSINIGSLKSVDLKFDPDEYTGKKNQIVIEGDKVNASTMPVTFKKETPGFMFASTTWHFSTEKLPEKAEGDFLSVDRKYFLRQTVGDEVQLKPLAEGTKVKVGDEVEVQISIKSKHQVDYVHLRDPRGAGFEPTSVNSQHKWDLGIYWYEEIRDSGTNFFFEHLPQGEYTFKYRVRASMAGEFQVSPATLQPMYAPEFAAYSSGQRLKVQPQ